MGPAGDPARFSEDPGPGPRADEFFVALHFDKRRDVRAGRFCLSLLDSTAVYHDSEVTAVAVVSASVRAISGRWPAGDEVEGEPWERTDGGVGTGSR